MRIDQHFREGGPTISTTGCHHDRILRALAASELVSTGADTLVFRSGWFRNHPDHLNLPGKPGRQVFNLQFMRFNRNGLIRMNVSET
jgi:hypothetical protein